MTRVWLHDSGQDEKRQVRTISELSDLHLTKEEKAALAKLCGQWSTGLKRIGKTIEKEHKHLENKLEKQM